MHLQIVFSKVRVVEMFNMSMFQIFMDRLKENEPQKEVMFSYFRMSYLHTNFAKKVIDSWQKFTQLKKIAQPPVVTIFKSAREWQIQWAIAVFTGRKVVVKLEKSNALQGVPKIHWLRKFTTKLSSCLATR